MDGGVTMQLTFVLCSAYIVRCKMPEKVRVAKKEEFEDRLNMFFVPEANKHEVGELNYGPTHPDPIEVVCPVLDSTTLSLHIANERGIAVEDVKLFNIYMIKDEYCVDFGLHSKGPGYVSTFKMSKDEINSFVINSYVPTYVIGLGEKKIIKKNIEKESEMWGFFPYGTDVALLSGLEASVFINVCKESEELKDVYKQYKDIFASSVLILRDPFFLSSSLQ